MISSGLQRTAALVCAVVVAGVAQAASDTSAAVGVRAPGGDWLTFDYNPQRSGVDPLPTGITAHTLRFLRRRTVTIDGTVDSAPVELHAVRVAGRTRDVVIVTTTYGRTLALDPRTGARLWQFQPAGYRALVGSAQITTATPVIDPDRRFVYAASPDGRIHKLAIANGRQRWSTPITFDSTHEKIAGALNVTSGFVVAATGGYYGDAPPYQGHVVLIDRASGRIAAVFNTLCSSRQRLIDPRSCPASDSAIWARSGSVVEPDGRILLATGNGPFNGSTDWGDSVLELSPELQLLHNYTPTNQAQLEQTDTDLGSGSPALLSGRGGSRLALIAGKDGILRLLDLARLNGTPGPAGPRTGGELQRLAAPGSAPVFTAPAVWRDRRGRTNVFVASSGGTADYVLTRADRLAVSWQNSTPGASPIVAGGLLYVYDATDGALLVYRPSSGARLARLPAAPGHWNSPIVVGGRIILPEGDANNHATSGTLDIYHLPGR